MSLIYASLAMATAGLLIGETGASLSLMVDSLSLDASAQGSIVAVRFIGGVVCGLLLWVRARTLPLGRGIQISLLATVVTTPLLMAGSYAAAWTVALVRGLTVGFVIPASGVFASRQQRWSTGGAAAIMNAALSAGLVLVSVIALLLSGGSGQRWELYWLVGPVLALVTLLVGWAGGAVMVAEDNRRAGRRSRATGAVPDAATTSPQAPLPGRDGRSHADSGAGSASPREPLPAAIRRLAQATVWRFSLASFFIVGTESVLLGLMPRLTALAGPGTGAATERFALAVMLGILAGRLLGTAILRRVQPQAVVTTSVLALLAAGAFWSVAGGPVLGPAMFLMGLATANVFPSVVGVISRSLGSEAPVTVASMGWMGGLGGTAVPPLIAIAAAQIASSAAVMGIVLLPISIAVLLVLSAARSAAATAPPS